MENERQSGSHCGCLSQVSSDENLNEGRVRRKKETVFMKGNTNKAEGINLTTRRNPEGFFSSGLKDW